MNKIKENKSEVGFKVKKNRNTLKFKPTVDYMETDGQYYCKSCDYITDNVARLKAHLVVHSVRRPYSCKHDNCGQTFKRNNSLKRHVSAVHLGERLYSCNICQKKFSQSQSLNDHIFIHLEIKSFKCLLDDCNKCFQTPKSLKAHQNRRHMRTVLQINQKQTQKLNDTVESMKTKAIQQLNSMIADKSLLTNTDIQNVRPYKLFKCTFRGCGQSFQLQRTLRLHYKSVHKKNKNKKQTDVDTDDDNDSDDSQTDVSDDENTTEEEEEYDEEMETNVKEVDDKCDKNYSQRQTNHYRSDKYIIDRISSNSYTFECNFNDCVYKTKSFNRIAEHFAEHWKQNPIEFFVE